jgi:serine/threonine protein kinase
MEDDSLIGEQLGAYLIQVKLGEGGMAMVYKAYQARLRRDVAIKVILSEVADHADFQVRFEREAQLIASLEHPNIVAVYDFGEVNTLTYLVMQYVGGGTLRDQMRGGQPIEPRRAVNYALQMARALHHAHKHGIVHRDVKPQNMLISASDPNHLLLSDFGIAKLFDTTHETTWVSMPSGSIASNPSLTSVDQIVGTAEYMAPEQVRRQPVDARTDVYALGVVLFQMLTGRVPFQSTTATGLMYQHVYTPSPPIREVNPAIPDVLAQIVAKALAKAPEARFQSAEEMAQVLEVAFTHQLSAPLTGYDATMQRFPPQLSSSDVASPTFRYGPLSAPGASGGSAYGPQSTPYATAPPSYSLPSTSGVVPRTITGGRTGHPSLSRPRNLYRVQIGVVVLLIVLALGLTFSKLLPLGGGSGGNGTEQSTSPAKAFIDTFGDNHNQWIEGNVNGLTASISNGHYSLSTDAQQNTHFLYPAAVGALPGNFTLTAQITQSAGADSIAYGLAFHLTSEGNQVKSCYAFVITSGGNYGILRYSNGMLDKGWSGQWNGQSSALHLGLGHSNELQAVVQGSIISLKINGQIVETKTGTTVIDSAYTGGQLGILVAGPSTSFTVTKVQLTIQ